MREPSQIVEAFDQLCRGSKPSALATVIAVEGSSYRRPGAQMLIAEDGRNWGGVSGGCLEKDVVRRARGVIETGAPLAWRYDTTDDEDDFAGGPALGCRGIIDIYIESLSAESPGPLPTIRSVLEHRRAASFATVVRASGVLCDCLGQHLSSFDLGSTAQFANGELDAAVRADLREALVGRQTAMVHYQLPGGQGDVFVQYLTPPQSLVIFGAGSDVEPLLEIARTLGWHVTVVAPPSASGARQRFAAADSFHITKTGDPIAGVAIEADAAVVVMNHSYPRDAAVLGALSRGPLRYLGVLGPRQRTGRLLADLGGESRPWNVFAPIGLDLGAQTPESIALAIMSEIHLVLNGAGGGSMRDRPGPIHPTGRAYVPAADCGDAARPPLRAESAQCTTRPAN